MPSGLQVPGSLLPASGAIEHLATAEALQHFPDLSRYWKYALPDLTPGDFDLETTVRVAAGRPMLNIDPITETVAWDDSGPTLSGTLTVARPEIDDPSTQPVRSGMDVRLRTLWGGKWYELWTMRAEEPQVAQDGTATIQLLDDMDAVRRTERDFMLRAPRGSSGYTCDEWTRIVCHRINVPVGYLEKGRRRIRRLLRPSTSALTVINDLYQLEHARSGVRFFPRMENGRLVVYPYRRNPILYVLGDMLTDVSEQPTGTARPVTVITGKGRVGTGRDAQHVEFTGYNEAVVRRFGYVHRDRDMGRVEDMADLRERVQRALATAVRSARAGTFTTPGIPFIRRGDGIELDAPEFGYVGRARFVFISGIQHSASAGQYTSAVSVTATDLFSTYQRALEKAQRAKVRKARGR